MLIELNILPKEVFATDDLIQIAGDAAPGYEVRHVKISPESISVAAKQEVLDQLTDLSLDHSIVNVEGLKETAVFQLKVQKPSEDTIISNETITVTVEIEPEEP